MALVRHHKKVSYFWGPVQVNGGIVGAMYRFKTFCLHILRWISGRPATCDLRPATCDLRPATCDLRPATCDLRPANLVNHASRFCVKGFFCALICTFALICAFALVATATAAETAQEPEFASAPSATYTSDDARAQKKPQPQPPSFSMAHLPPAPVIKLQTLNSNEVTRLRPNSNGLIPIGVHRKLPPNLIQDVLPEDLDTASNNANNKDNLLPVPPPRSQTKAKTTRTHSLVQGAWQWVGNGRLWRAQIHSPGAQALRLHFQDFNVGTGRVWLHTLDTFADRSAAASPTTGSSTTGSATGSSASGLDADDLSTADLSADRSTAGLSITGGGEVYGPYTGRGMYGDGDFWSDIVFNSRLVIEYQPGPEDTRVVDRGPVPFRIQNISHITNLNLGRPSARQFASTTGSAAMQNQAAPYDSLLNQMAAEVGELGLPQRNLASCHLDVSCYSEWAGTARGVGLFSYESGDESYVCTGALLNEDDDEDDTPAPYFLTAAHCIDTNVQARSVIVFWDYENRYCNGGTPSRWSSARSNGARLLVTKGNGVNDRTNGDASLLQLLNDPPYGRNGRWYLGWWPREPTVDKNVVLIHHPDGEHKHISFGQVETSSSFSAITKVRWTRGASEGGSSGSPILATYDGDNYIIGIHSGSIKDEPVCSPRQRGLFSKLITFWPQIRRYLRPNEPEVTPIISYFRASQSTITKGDSVTLSWSSSNASSAYITYSGGTRVNVDTFGRRSFTPSATTLYALTVTSSTGHTTTETVYVRVDTPPPVIPAIGSFTASRTSIIRGQSTTLNWSSSNAVSASISPGFDNVSTQGTRGVTVSPHSTTTYILTVISSTRHTASARVTVRVQTAITPVIDSFTASKNSIISGQSVTLSWSSRDATRARITPGVGAVNLNGRIIVEPTSTTTYTLEVTSRTNHTARKRLTIDVTPPVIPIIHSFTASSTSIVKGESVTLSWNISQAANARITPGFASVRAYGSFQVGVQPQATTRYTLTATSSTGHTAEKHITINVVTSRQLTARFGSTQAYDNNVVIERGGSAVIHWVSQNATSARLEPGFGNVQTSGSRTVSPSQTTTYTLTLTGTDGRSLVKRTTVTVRATATNAPTVNLSASATSIERGDNVILTWSVTNAKYIQILYFSSDYVGVWDAWSQDDRPVSSGTIDNSWLIYTTTYMVVATGVNGQIATNSITIEVHNPEALLSPTINLTASSTSITRGQSVTLSWSMTGVVAARLLQKGYGAESPGSTWLSLAPSNSIEDTPQETTTYTLVMDGADGKVYIKSVTVYVRDP